MYKRLIEVDLPIRTISAHARREKSIRRGHISTLHIWWARRPLAACRAVILGALLPDPADDNCPPAFREAASRLLGDFAANVRASEDLVGKLGEAAGKWIVADNLSIKGESPWADPGQIRKGLLDFIGDAAAWEMSNEPAMLECARGLVRAAYPDSPPLVVDPFAGGGAIPLEALRVGADAFASDLNPVAVLLNKVVLEYVPKYGQQLADEVRKWGAWIKERAEEELAEFYPPSHLEPEAYTPIPDKTRKIAGVTWRLERIAAETPIAYLWARTIRCEGPACGAEVPLVRSLWLAKKGDRSVALQLVPDRKRKRVDFEIIQRHGGKWMRAKDEGGRRKNEDRDSSFIVHPSSFEGTVKRGSATCPVCGYTTPVARVRVQLKARRGGAADARLMAVVCTLKSERRAASLKRSDEFDEQGRFYRLPTKRDLDAVRKAADELERRKRAHIGPLSLVPDEKLDIRGIRHTWAMIYGLERWGDYFTPRQSLALTTLVRWVHEAGGQLEQQCDSGLAKAIQTCLALGVDRQADYLSSLTIWSSSGEFIAHTFGRQAIPVVWEWPECQPWADGSGNWGGAIGWIAMTLEALTAASLGSGHAEQASAATHLLPDDAAQAIITDPPYYDSVPYAHLSDFFYVWLRRSLNGSHEELFANAQVPKEDEIVVDRPHELSDSPKDIAFYERELTKAFAEARRVLQPDGIGMIVFASKTTASWEAILQAVADAGWIITGSWPIDTEREARVAAQGQARLASSIHLVCRPRENPDGSLRTDAIGDWRDVLAELPKRIHNWMPRLAQEGVVGADAIFACLGPALEIFSQYSRVETAGGKVVELREYLEHVWAAVGREALNQIFAGADPSGFEEDARLTALWLWTLSAKDEGGRMKDEGEEEGEESEEETSKSKAQTPKGFALEYDTARKLAQGIGAHLEGLNRPGGMVVVKGDVARLLAVTDRRRALFGRAAVEEPKPKKQSSKQLAFAEIEQSVGPVAPAPDAPGDGDFNVGETTLDRIHQSMLLFGEGRTEALKHLLVDDGVGKDDRFWRLANALSALYPASSQEKRWVDGVLARKKGLGV